MTVKHYHPSMTTTFRIRAIRNGLSTAALVSFVLNFPLLLTLLFGVGGKPGRGEFFSTYPEYFLNLFFCFLIGFILYIAHSGLLEKRVKSIWRYLVIFVLYLLVVFTVVYTHVYFLDVPEHFINPVRGMFAGQYTLTSLICILLANVFWLNQRQRTHLIEIERLAAENIRSQYNALRSQIDPHFLFNTLNTLNALIANDSEKAQNYLSEMTALLRHSFSRHDTITLREELEVARSYAYLMNIRYGEALTFRFEVEDRFLELPVVPFCLQIVLENAVKHNTITMAIPLIVTVRTDEGRLIVSNPIAAKKHDSTGEGIGLRNLSERFRLMTGKEIEIRHEENVFTVSMPLGDTNEKSHYPS